MARDENDRPYEDGQGRSLNPEMTGDVLSPRWSTDDTDEQPAIQVVGNETYILPPDKTSLTGLGEPQLVGSEGVRDVLDDAPVGGHDVLGGPHDVLGGASGPHDVLSGAGASSAAHDLDGGAAAYDLEGTSYDSTSSYESTSTYDATSTYDSTSSYDGTSYDGVSRDSGAHDTLGEHSGPHSLDDNPYLPLDRGYEGGQDDDRGDDKPKGGFLGSGWTGDSHEGHSRSGEREVRRRTRVLLIAAVAVVLVGVGAGFMLTGTSSDDPCAGAQCASAGEVTSPSESAAPEDTASEDEPTPDATDSATDEPTDSQPAKPAPTTQRARPTREPSSRPTNTRVGEPTTKASTRPTRASQPDMQDTDTSQDDEPAAPATSSPPKQQSTSQPTQAPATSQAPAPAPTKEEKGLLDILFPWA